MKYRIDIHFRLAGSSLANVGGNDSMLLLVDAGVKDRLLECFNQQDSVVSVDLGNGIMRHINTRNILYIDVLEFLDNQEGLLDGKE